MVVGYAEVQDQKRDITPLLTLISHYRKLFIPVSVGIFV